MEFSRLSLSERNEYIEQFGDSFVDSPLAEAAQSPLTSSTPRKMDSGKVFVAQYDIDDLRANSRYRGGRILADVVAIIGSIVFGLAFILIVPDDGQTPAVRILTAAASFYGIATLWIGLEVTRAIFDLADRHHQRN